MTLIWIGDDRPTDGILYGHEYQIIRQYPHSYLNHSTYKFINDKDETDLADETLFVDRETFRPGIPPRDVRAARRIAGEKEHVDGPSDNIRTKPLKVKMSEFLHIRSAFRYVRRSLPAFAKAPIIEGPSLPPYQEIVVVKDKEKLFDPILKPDPSTRSPIPRLTGYTFADQDNVQVTVSEDPLTGRLVRQSGASNPAREPIAEEVANP